MLKGGGTTSFEVVLTRELEFLAILVGGAKSFHLLKGGRKNVLPCVDGGCLGMQKVLDPQFSIL